MIEFLAVSRVSGEVLMNYEGRYPDALDVFDRQFGTEVDYIVVKRVSSWSVPEEQAYQKSRSS